MGSCGRSLIGVPREFVYVMEVSSKICDKLLINDVAVMCDIELVLDSGVDCSFCFTLRFQPKLGVNSTSKYPRLSVECCLDSSLLLPLVLLNTSRV